MRPVDVSETQGIKSQGHCKGDNCNESAAIVDANVAFATDQVLSAKVVQVGTRIVGSGTRVTTRRFSGSNQISITNSKTTNLARVNRTRVVTTRSWSSPGVNTFTSNGDRHSVFSFDAFNALPTYLDTLQGISNDYSFVTKGDFRSDKEEMGTITNEQSPRCSDQNCFCAVMGEGNSNFSDNNEVDNTSRDIDSLRAELSRVIHETILSQSSCQKGLIR